MTTSKKTIKLYPLRLLLVLLLVFSFTACKKDKDSKSQSTGITGNWVGKDGNGSDAPTYDFYFTIKNGGSIDVTNASGQVKGSGTWTLNGAAFIAHYQYKAPLYTKYTIKGTYDASHNKLSGTWGFDDGEYDEGTWYSNKKP